VAIPRNYVGCVGAYIFPLPYSYLFPLRDSLRDSQTAGSNRPLAFHPITAHDLRRSRPRSRRRSRTWSRGRRSWTRQSTRRAT
jgi:hypothetical protein